MVTGVPNLFTETRLTRALPALVVLPYPLLIHMSATKAPVLVSLALVLPILCGYLAYRIARAARFPMGTAVAFVAIGAPALYSLMGGWLDFQKLLPFHADAAWYAFWTIAAGGAALESPAAVSVPQQQRRGLAFAHGMSAALIGAFAAVHLSNHVSGIFGGDVHTAFMTAARKVYRQWFVEVPLVVAVVFQVASGITLLVRRVRHGLGDAWSALQVISGAYMVLFFMSHVSAVARARYLRHSDTDWHWLTADDLLTDPWSARLLPYYVLGVLAFGVHVACGLRWVAIAHKKSAEFAATVFSVTFGLMGLAGAVIAVALIRASHHA